MDNIELIKRINNAINGLTYSQGGLNLNQIRKILKSYGIKVNGPRRVTTVELNRLLPELKEFEDEMADQLMMIGDEFN